MKPAGVAKLPAGFEQQNEVHHENYQATLSQTRFSSGRGSRYARGTLLACESIASGSGIGMNPPASIRLSGSGFNFISRGRGRCKSSPSARTCTREYVFAGKRDQLWNVIPASIQTPQE
jgi:hypothetical protein